MRLPTVSNARVGRVSLDGDPLLLDILTLSAAIIRARLSRLVIGNYAACHVGVSTCFGASLVTCGLTAGMCIVRAFVRIGRLGSVTGGDRRCRRSRPRVLRIESIVGLTQNMSILGKSSHLRNLCYGTTAAW